MARIAVVLFNLGGPNSLEAVRPFLFNLFNDPAILDLPTPLRYALAKLISWRRAPVTRDIYTRLGGHSPLLDQTKGQREALERVLRERGHDVHCLIAMRYWEPFISEAVKRVAEIQPDQLVLLPLYPQFSGTTAGSSLVEWDRAARKAGLVVPTQRICCYPSLPGFVNTVARSTLAAINEVRAVAGEPRVLFSAHGLPLKMIQEGDPYQKQIVASVDAMVGAIGDPALDWRVCYQSRIGRMEWIGPSIREEIVKAGAERKPLVIVPISFVSEHSETLVELDIEYAQFARETGVPYYIRTPTVGRQAGFIDGLAGLVENALDPASSGQVITPEAPGFCEGCMCCPCASERT
ncbi:ferrochelatase [Phaeovibrio sulfidiphilus]|uniref:Ferrochelatase n=1 Tax=Phaeovibrio sulfidiphilus TaxID=1220600 RepID=A0A8J6YP45_9PROT|nr:ferrochelatase [Phaeovibrio sulfidiphilus]MBE1236592.1 ferrochelatase [Phaeovibrio sulfidiphilus]